MADYSFMKSGFSDAAPSVDTDDLKVMLSLFISRAMEHAVRYSKICRRDGVTKDDLVYALKYEVFEFFNNPNINNELDLMKREYLEYLAESEDEEYDPDQEYDSNEDHDNDYEPSGIGDFVVDDEEIETFTRANIEEVETKDKEFVNNIHNYVDRWDTWVPTTPIEETLKNAIEKTYC